MRCTFDNFDKGGMWDMYVSNIDHPDAKLYWEGLSTVNSPSGILKQGSHYKYEPCQPNEFSSHIVKAAFVSFSLPLCSTKPLFFSQGMSSSLSSFLVILFNSSCLFLALDIIVWATTFLSWCFGVLGTFATSFRDSSLIWFLWGKSTLDLSRRFYLWSTKYIVWFWLF